MIIHVPLVERPYCQLTERNHFFILPEDGITRSKYWFFDGDVMVQVEDTHFRVHQSMLCKYSPVFEDVLSKIPDSYYGYPVRIQLTDKAADFECLMSLIYGRSRLWKERVPMPFEKCAAILRLGKEYKIEYFFEDALQRFRNVFPDTLSGWYKQDMHRLSPEGIELDLDRDPFIYERAMALANELSITRALPAICLSLIKAKNTTGILQSLGKHAPTEDAYRFVPRLLMTCMEGHNRISCQLTQRIQEWVDMPETSPIPSQDCTRTESCISNRTHSIIAMNSGANTTPQVGITGITIFWDDTFLRLSDELSKLICRECEVSMLIAIQRLKADLWSDLPSILRIGDCWEDLKDFES